MPRIPQILPPDLTRVLVVMIDHHLGNFCIAMPVIRRLSEYFRHAPDLVVNDRHEDLARLMHLPGRVIPARRSGSAYAGIFARLALRYRAVIDIGTSVRSSSLTAMTLAGVRIGEAGSPREWVFNRRQACMGDRHTFDRYARTLACIGEMERPPLVTLAAPPEVRGRVLESIEDDGTPIAVIHPGAGKRFRSWPLERFAQVADELYERWGMRSCIIGVPSERELADEVIGHMRHPDGARTVFLGLVELVALFESARVLVCNESGPMHLAAMTDLPIVAMYGPTPEAIWAPVRTHGVITLRGGDCDPGCGKRVCTGDARCLLGTSVDEVLEAVAELIS